MAQRDEVGVFGQPTHLGEDDAPAVDAWQTLDEVKGDVGPYLRRYLQGLQEARRLQRLHLVPLAHGARSYKVAHQGTIMLDEELRAEPVERFLDSFMAGGVGEL